MKKYSDTELKNIFNDIINGSVYIGINKNNCGVGEICTGCVGYIYFKHYGQTACRKDFEQFRKELYIMFDDCVEIVPGVYSEYHINYIPQDLNKYNAVDFSFNHPNVYGC